MTSPRKILLFVPGYYGSRLKEKNSGELRWAKAANFLFSNKGLSQNIPGTEIGEKTELVTDGILNSVTIIPKILHYDSYGETLKHLDEFAREQKMELHTVDYDWRDDFINCLQVIHQKIESFQLRENDELVVVAHSMGGTLMSYYLRYGNEDVFTAAENWAGLKTIKKLILVAPPLHGLMILFRDIGEGTSRGFNRQLLSALDYSTFKSSYFFLPLEGDDLAFDENKNLFSLGIHQTENWSKNNWGPFKFARNSDERTIVYKFVDNLMKRSKKFHELMKAPVKKPPAAKIPILHLWGVGEKTKEIATTFRDQSQRLDYRFKKEGEVDGDGTVTTKSAQSLEFFYAFDLTRQEEQDGHLDILSDKDSQKAIHDFLQK